jgi:type IV secretory pathway TrbL component
MNLIMLLIIIVITIFILEVTKHVLFKSFSKTMIMVILLITVFFVIVATLQYQNDIETDNPIVTTGAAIVESVADEGYLETIQEKLNGIKDSISDSFS